MQQWRRTKIVATLGPAIDKPEVLMHALQAGINVVRANFSHGDVNEHCKRIELVRKQAAELGKPVGILVDLQGPKVRIAAFKEGKITLVEGQQFILDAGLASDAGTRERVGLDYKKLPNEVNQSTTLLVDDGRLRLKVNRVQGQEIICTVIEGGELSNNKGINLHGGGLAAGSITEKDETDIQLAVKLKVDYIALSFIRNANDIHQARHLMGEAGRYIGIIAKIERTEALNAIDEIIEASDGIMVARGDLGIEIGEAEVPGVQKQLIERARHLNKPVITATQMMESMIYKKLPTRAEVSDVANAVLDGTDAVMLSAETAVGEHPDLVVAAVSRTCLAAEKHPSMSISRHRVDHQFRRVDEAVAMASMYTANHMNIKAIIALTESGATPLWMSRIDSGIPIYGLSRHALTRGKMALFRGVYPVRFDVTKIAREKINEAAIAELRKHVSLVKGDLVVLTKGDDMGVLGGSNTMKVVKVV